MTHLESLQFLIESAAKVAGSENKLAQMLGIKQQHVNAWKHGTRTATPEDQALLAAIAGFDPVQTLARATVEKWEGKPKGDRLRKVLGKLSHQTGVALGFAGAGALAIYSTIGDAIQCASGKTRKHNERYVKRHRRLKV